MFNMVDSVIHLHEAAPLAVSTTLRAGSIDFLCNSVKNEMLFMPFFNMLMMTCTQEYGAACCGRINELHELMS